MHLLHVLGNQPSYMMPLGGCVSAMLLLPGPGVWLSGMLYVSVSFATCVHRSGASFVQCGMGAAVVWRDWLSLSLPSGPSLVR
jgi:hypothetical protein